MMSFLVLLCGLQCGPVAAWADGSTEPVRLMMAEEPLKWPIKPSQAAVIASHAHPGSVVLSVTLLPSGEYAVTLKVGGNVLRVTINATTGAAG